MIHGNAPPRRLPLHGLGIALLMFLSIAGLCQCRRVSERVAGADRSAAAGELSGNRACTARCNHRYRDQLKHENARHEGELKACDGNRDCRAKERACHQGAIAALKAERWACKRGCYNEGGGGSSH